MTWYADAQQGFETNKVRYEIVPWTRGKVLNVGAGYARGFPHFITVDDRSDNERFGHSINPDLVCGADDLWPLGNQSFDSVFSSHLLEHLNYATDAPAALKEWWRVLRPGGYLVLYLPDEDEYPKVGQKGANPDHKWDVNYDRVVSLMVGVGVWDLVEFQKRNAGHEYSLLFVFRKRTSGQCLESWRNKKKPDAPTACVVRYGAFGDMLMAASVCAGLKKQGYHVTLMCSPPGSDVIRNDPNVDVIMEQDRNQVPNPALADFWAHWRPKFDRWVNLCESLEATLLALPERPNHGFSDEVRRKYMGTVNYLQFQHELAGVPHEPAVKFYATDEERAWAKKTRARMGGPVILWSLSGSSVHKTNASLDPIVARVMLRFPSAHVVLVGGDECQILEAGWEKEPRVHRTSGRWTIRQTLSFLPECDLVVGGETGVMHAVSHEPVPKIVFLSHSSATNLTRDWTSCVTLQPAAVKCFPCHRMHYGWEHCFKDEDTGTALCQAHITPDMIWPHVENILKERELKRAG